jgi:hypothetical protein
VVSGQWGRAEGFNPSAVLVRRGCAVIWGHSGPRRRRRRALGGEGEAVGELCGEVEGEGGFSGGGITGEEGEFSEGDAVFPEPAEGLGGDVGERDGTRCGHVKLLSIENSEFRIQGSEFGVEGRR